MFKGFTLIEVLIYTAITAVVGMLMTGILLSVSQVHQRESASTEVTSQLNFVTQTIGRLVRSSSNIEITAGVSTSTIKLRMQNPAKDPTCISLVGGTIKLAEGPGANPNNCTTTTSDLTNTRVIVNALNFRKFVQYPGHDTVSYDIQMTYNSQNPRARVQRSLSSGIARVSAATFDSNLLPGASTFEIGQVGSPWSRAYLNDGTALNPSYTFANNTGLGLFRAGTNILGFTTAGTERMRIDASGNVGIGTTAPTQKLTVAGGHGDTKLRLSASGFGQPAASNDAFLSLWASEPGWTLTGAGIGNNILGSPHFGRINTARGASYMRLLDSAIAFGTINSAGTRFADTLYMIHGNVGIGTTAPGARLDIQGNNDQIRISQVAGGVWSSVYPLNAAGTSIGALIWSTDNAWLESRTGNLIFGTGGVMTERMRITSTGNVGIGTTAPTGRLGISGGNIIFEEDLTERFIATRTFGGAIRFRGNAATAADRTLQLGTRDNMGVFSPRLTVDTNTGNVGIGTTAPAERLHVIGNILKTGTVSFIEDYPSDPSKQIVYVSLEGPEVGTYIRGAANCQNSEAVIVFPDYFRLVTAENGLTAQLTPRFFPANLYIKELTNEKLVVGCGSGTSFDYLVNGLRKGYENHQVIRQK